MLWKRMHDAARGDFDLVQTAMQRANWTLPAREEAFKACLAHPEALKVYEKLADVMPDEPSLAEALLQADVDNPRQLGKLLVRLDGRCVDGCHQTRT